MAEAKLSPVQRAVQIVTEVTLLGMDGKRYAAAISELHELMATAAVTEARDALFDGLPDEVQAMPVSAAIEWFTSEDQENSHEAEAYWAATSRFYRRVYQACAAGCN